MIPAAGIPLLFSLFTLTLGVLAAFPDPLKLSGSVLIHDPSLVQRASDGKYFLFTTHNKGGILTATNLAGPWTSVGSILPSDSSINLPGRDDIWAPDVSLHGSTYYAYYAVSTFGSQNSAIGLATSSSMDPGTWTDQGQVFASSTGAQFNAIDPNVVIDEKGVPVLTFGSFWSDIFQVSLGSNFKTVSGSATQVSFNSTNPQPEEGAFIWKHGSFYYLFFSSGLCCGFDANALPPAGNEYKVFVGRSSSAHGPFLDKNGKDLRQTGGTLVLASHGNVYAPGGQSIFTDSKSGKDVFVYHYVPVNSAQPYSDAFATLGLNAIDWSSGWPVLTSL
ncbi:glycoside hydrolase family 43 protein [Trametes versicolor FP-101664 SS1]|uniref:glycoside hydrolase family 43 protein n=1 Tax=Trametes versicolor (strain FP-101664) TaxID=717944 RepID=UPI0004621271|nr:glycoside hydrolase family 43 protein [Trametes versicolor FP-101664 SS1]EIW59347.1 glycoside hydrolase family 43 protein [Trametes versicolor FP-101664 SS1]